MFERKLIAAALNDRGAYEAILASDIPAGLDELVRPIWDEIEGFYTRDPDALRTDPEIIAKRLETAFPNPKKGKEYVELVLSIAGETVSVPNIGNLIATTARWKVGNALAAAIAGRKEFDEIAPLLERFTELVTFRNQESLGSVDEPGDDWGTVLRSRVDQTNRIVVSPRVLNQHIAGGVVPGHNVTIFGRPESGKTALAITMAAGFARRGKKILYIGNEDPIQDLMVRFITNFTDKTMDELAQDPDGFEKLALEKGARHVTVKATAPGTILEIERLVKHHRPDVLFVDQLRNISSGKSDNYTQLLDKNAQGVRALGKRYGLVTVSVTQAGDSASGKPILDMGDVDSSNTGIPGAADLMIGVGVTEALDAAGQRMLSLCKNKLGVVKPAVLVTLDPYRSKMK